ncbi:hypothetical protein ULMA_21330 [Patiriisocius marinus]|uniref:Uncharacterized protein n=2 Tax=Patiriisocius marinus TaxID=1397112 RepID=A0A5J4IQE3_9FLAO|nr:hypothetical protein ULMA_21330 [Patiriisocius marinus]
MACSNTPKTVSTTVTTERFKIEIPRDQQVSSNGINVNFKEYKLSQLESIRFIVSGTFGTSVLKPTEDSGLARVVIPSEISQIAGQLEWILMEHEHFLEKGDFRLMPTASLGTVENYLGPRSITASKRDNTMLVTVPTDSLDNMLPDDTAISMNHQFKGQTVKTPVKLKAGFGWKRIAAPLVTGRLSTGSTVGVISSKELVADVFPDIAQDFSINYERTHPFADGNELMSIKTSQIKDAQGNIMTDGTLVNFFIVDEKNNHWQTTSSTINGYAFAKILHPELPCTLSVNAVIKGMAESPKMTVDFKSIITEIPKAIFDNSTLKVGPLTSYLGQLVQDGVEVELQLNETSWILLTKDGYVSQELDSLKFPKGTYSLTVKTLGLESTYPITID